MNKIYVEVPITTNQTTLSIPCGDDESLWHFTVIFNENEYLHPKFKKFFDERAGECTDGLYPTVSVRQIMWALKMKPIQRQRWETCFDRRNI